MRRGQIATLGFLAASTLSGCAADLGSYREGYGLRPVELELAAEDEAQLNQGGLEGDPIPARLFVGRDRLPGWLWLSGQGSLTNLKRGYSFEVRGALGAFGYRSVRITPQVEDSSMLRTLLGLRVFRALGVAAPEVEPVALYLHGEYAGLYLMVEKIDEGFFERRGLEVERLYESQYGASFFGPEMIADPASGLQAKIGELVKLEVVRMVEWVSGTPDAVNLAEAARTFDVGDWVAFTAAQRFLLNCDSFFNNLFLWKRSGDARFRPVAWDWTFVYSDVCAKTVFEIHTPLVRQFYAHPELKTQIEGLTTGLKRRGFDATSVRNAIDQDRARISAAYQADPYLGGRGKDLSVKAAELFALYEAAMAGL